MNSFQGKAYIVTGAGSGIGRASAVALAEYGGNVIVADRNEDAGRETVEIIGKTAGKGVFVQTDVTSEQEVIRMVDAAKEHFGRLDGACNAAGRPSCSKYTHEISAEEWDECFAVNLRGLFFSMKYQIEAMLPTGGGSIVAIGSNAAQIAFRKGSDYCAMKSGVMGLVRGAALDYAQEGIRVNAVLPGCTSTPMLHGAFVTDDGLKDALMATLPMKRFAKVEEIAGAVRWLLSDEAGFTTGTSLTVDGGHTAM